MNFNNPDKTYPNLTESEVQVKIGLDMIIEEKEFDIAIRILNKLKDSFPLYNQYMNQIKKLQ